MSARSEAPNTGSGLSKPAVFHREAGNSKRVQRSNSNLSATSSTAPSASAIGVGESKFVKDKRKMVSTAIY